MGLYVNNNQQHECKADCISSIPLPILPDNCNAADFTQLYTLALKNHVFRHDRKIEQVGPIRSSFYLSLLTKKLCRCLLFTSLQEGVSHIPLLLCKVLKPKSD